MNVIEVTKIDHNRARRNDVTHLCNGNQRATQRTYGTLCGKRLVANDYIRFSMPVVSFCADCVEVENGVDTAIVLR